MIPFKKSPMLLTVGEDSKTVKGNKLNVMTGIMYLAPADISTFQVCPKASDGCKAACLYTAGRGKMTMTQTARINKTLWFFQERKTFMAQLVKDIGKVARKAENQNMIPAIRLNGTSDIAWEKIKVEKDGKQYRNVMEAAYPDVQFYDYTKIIGRKSAIELSNYHLTFSLSEDNDSDAIKSLSQGYNVAVVFDIKKNQPKPESWSGYPVIDGDDTDVRFFDPNGGHIVGLTAKGDAMKDDSGFVRNIKDSFNVLNIKVA